MLRWLLLIQKNGNLFRADARIGKNKQMTTLEQEPTVLQLLDLSGQVALVTGAGGHLGSAMARTLAEAGGRVIATSRDADRATEIAAALPDPQGVGHLGIALDHMEPESIERCFDTAIKKTGRVDVLVNNGQEHALSGWADVTAEQFTRQLANATGYFLLARHVRNHAVQCNSPASVVMLGSMYGQVASYPEVYQGVCPDSPVAYHALKGGIIHLTRHLAVYWAKDKIRVNCLSPGPFPSPSAPQGLADRVAAKTPVGRIGQPHELKGALLLLASDAGSYITGQNLVVDGGWTAW